MRTIRLRAWDSTNKEFIYIVVTKGAHVIHAVTQSTATLEPWLQWTGLVDKKGKEIYEGDFIQPRLRDEVVFERGTFGVHTFIGWRPLYSFEVLEVVGNIYENPELVRKYNADI